MSVRQFPPEGVHSKEFNDSPDTLWLYIQPKKLAYGAVYNTRGEQAIQTSVIPDGPIYKLLMPVQYSTSQNHEWEKFESVGAKTNELAT